MDSNTFLEDFWNFQNVHQISTFPPLFLCRNASNNTKTIWDHPSLKYFGDKYGVRGSRFGLIFGRSRNLPKSIATDQESLINHLGIIKTPKNPIIILEKQDKPKKQFLLCRTLGLLNPFLVIYALVYHFNGLERIWRLRDVPTLSSMNIETTYFWGSMMAPKTGSNRAQNMAICASVVRFFFVFECNYGGLGGFNYSQMAN